MFLTKPKAGAESRSVWGDFWFSQIPFNGGANVTCDAAMQLTAVYACVRNAAEDTSTLPFYVRRIGKGGKKELLKKHWLYRLFAKRPNAFQNPMEFREMMQGHVELRGNAFAEIFANSRGEVTDLIPIHPDRVTVELLDGGNWRYEIRRLDGTTYRLTREQMFHLKGLSSNGIIGYNPIQVARGAVATGLAAQDYGYRFFQNDAKPGGWIEHPKSFANEEQGREWRRRWQELYSGKNRHQTAVLEYGMKYHELTVNNDDAQFIETKKYSTSEIARMWRMPPHMIGDLERSTNNNIEHQSLEYVIYSIRPRLIRWEEAIKFAFLDPDDDSIEVEFSVLALLRGDAKSRADYLHSMVLDGILTRNEAREMEGRNPIDGLDEPLRPLNMVEEGAAEDAEGDGGADNSRRQVQPAQPDARLAALSTAAAERVARKEVEMVMRAAKADDWPAAVAEAYGKHAQFVASALNVPMQEALAYCDQRRNEAQNDLTLEQDVFQEIARCKLERLAIKGTI